MEIYNVRVNGYRNPLNVIDDFDLSFRLDFTYLAKAELTIFDEFNNVIYNTIKVGGLCHFYAKLDLKPLRKYSYKLVVNNKYEYVNYFYSGLVNGFDSNAKFIKDPLDNKNSDEVGSKALYFKKEFYLDNINDFAIINIVGLGTYQLYINNKLVNDSCLNPPFTNYNKTVLYQTYDVKEYLQVGNNEILVVLGEGFYSQSTIDTWDFYKASFKDDLKLLLQLNVGNKVIVSDTSFKVSYGKILANAIRLGEKIDYNATYDFRNVVEASFPKGVLKPTSIKEIKEVKSYGYKIVYQDENKAILDFGINMAGYIQGIFKGNKNDVVEVIYSDRLVDNDLDNTSNAQYIYNESFKYQTDTLILSGNDDFYKPSFVYHGFRYVMIKGNVQFSKIKAHLICTDFVKEGNFYSDDELLNKLYDMSIQAIRSNYVGFPTDCPHREKNGWTGDAYLSADTCLLTFDMHQAYKKWLYDMIDSQKEDGIIPCIIPTDLWGYTWGNGPCWDVAMFRLSLAMYENYNDIEMVKVMYPTLVKYLSYLSTKAVNNLVEVGLGDWNYPKNITFEVCSTKLLASCYYYYMVNVLIKLSKVLGYECECYINLSKDIKEAIKNNYSNEKTLTGMAALTYFEIDNKITDILEYLKVNDYSYHMGIHGMKLVLDSLLKYDQIEEGYKILTRNDYPSFKYWIDKGQTTLCEDFELTNSLNHHMFSSIVSFIIKGIAGIHISNDGLVYLKESKKKINFKVKVPTFNGVYKFEFNDEEFSVEIPGNGLLMYKGEVYKAGKRTIKR